MAVIWSGGQDLTARRQGRGGRYSGVAFIAVELIQRAGPGQPFPAGRGRGPRARRSSAPRLARSRAWLGDLGSPAGPRRRWRVEVVAVALEARVSKSAHRLQQVVPKELARIGVSSGLESWSCWRSPEEEVMTSFAAARRSR